MLHTDEIWLVKRKEGFKMTLQNTRPQITGIITFTKSFSTTLFSTPLRGKSAQKIIIKVTSQ